MKKIYAFIFSTAIIFPLTAQNFLDPTFDSDGVALINYNDSFEEVPSLALQADGKILVAGHDNDNITDGMYGIVTRLMPDGSHDNSFDEDGVAYFGEVGVEASIQFYDVTPDNEGRIVVCGYMIDQFDGKMVVVRFLQDGSLDNSFGGTGSVLLTLPGCLNSYAYRIIPQGDGKLVLGGESRYEDTDDDLTIVRLLEDGSLDTDFGAGGVFTHDMDGHNDQIYGLAIDWMGNIFFTGDAETPGTRLVIGKVTPNGLLDTAFNNGLGYYLYEDGSHGRDLILAMDGDVVVTGFGPEGGTGNQDLMIVRLNADGTPVESFGEMGVMFHVTEDYTSLGAAILESFDGSFLVASSRVPANDYGEFMLTRYSADGEHITTFGDEGYIVTEGLENSGNTQAGLGLAVQEDGKILVSGRSNATGSGDGIVVRFGDGTIDTPVLQPLQVSIYPNPAETDLRVSAGERIRSIRITDNLGRFIMEINHNDFLASIDISDLAEGIYNILVICSDDKIYAGRFMK